MGVEEEAQTDDRAGRHPVEWLFSLSGEEEFSYLSHHELSRGPSLVHLPVSTGKADCYGYRDSLETVG